MVRAREGGGRVVVAGMRIGEVALRVGLVMGGVAAVVKVEEGGRDEESNQGLFLKFQRGIHF